MGDRRDRVEDRAALLRAVPADQRLRLLVGGVRVLRGDLEQRVLSRRGRIRAAGIGAGEQADEVPGEVPDCLPGDREEGDGESARRAAERAS